MTREELVKMIEDTAGKAVATALAAVQEKSHDAQAIVQQQAVNVEGPEGAVRLDRSLIGERRAMSIGGSILCLAAAKGDLERAIKIASGPEWKGMPDVLKVLTSGEATQGGVLIAPEHSQELIDLLAPRTVVRRHIPDVMDVSAGMVDMARMTADASTSWGGEIEEITEGNPTFDQLVMRPFQQKVLVPVSNTLLRRGGPRVSTMVRNSTLRSMALGEDSVFLTSPGSEHRPKGLRYWVPTANQAAATTWTGSAAEKLAIATTDLGRLLLLLEEANVPMTNPVWFIAPRTKQYLLTAQNSVGAYVYRDEMIRGTLWGIPYEATTHIARNGGTGGDESYIYLADCDEFMLGQGQSLQVDLSTEGTFVDSDGNVVSAFQRNLTLLRIINEVDLKPKHVEAAAYLSGVKWAPGT